jgi:hypothetical protein
MYFFGLDALFSSYTVMHKTKDKLGAKNIAKVTVSANWPLLYLKGLGHEIDFRKFEKIRQTKAQIKEAAGFQNLRSSSDSIFYKNINSLR